MLSILYPQPSLYFQIICVIPYTLVTCKDRERGMFSMIHYTLVKCKDRGERDDEFSQMNCK